MARDTTTQWPDDAIVARDSALVARNSLARPLLLVIGVSMMIFSQWMASSQSGTSGDDKIEVSENKFKAAYCISFLKGTDWPDGVFRSSSAPFVLGILGSDPFGGMLDGITNQLVRNRPVILKKFQRVEEAKDCHLVVLSALSETKLAEALADLRDSNILTVGDNEKFTRLGGIVTFTLNKKHPFEINKKAMKQAGLSMDSQMMELGKVIR